MSGLTAHVDLSRLGEGWHTIRLSSPGLKLPPGVSAERLAPETISLRLARTTHALVKGDCGGLRTDSSYETSNI